MRRYIRSIYCKYITSAERLDTVLSVPVPQLRYLATMIRNNETTTPRENWTDSMRQYLKYARM